MSDNWYKEYLETEEWKKTRGKRLAIDKYQCKFCGSKENLQVHHLSYNNIGNEDVEADLITLCKPCHESIHQVISLHRELHKGFKEDYEKECRQAIQPIAERYKKLLAVSIASGTKLMERKRKTGKDKRAKIASVIANATDASIGTWAIRMYGLKPPVHQDAMQGLKYWDEIEDEIKAKGGRA